MKEILATIARLREERGWTEYCLAERSGLPQSTISSYVSVTGFDGTEMAGYYIPAITTVRQPTATIARESVALLCDMLGGAPARHVTVDYALVDGESIGPAK